MAHSAVAPLLVYTSFGVATAVWLAARLNYLPLNVQQPTPSWGNMLHVACTLSGMAIYGCGPSAIITVMPAVSFVVNGNCDALDPTRFQFNFLVQPIDQTIQQDFLEKELV